MTPTDNPISTVKRHLVAAIKWTANWTVLPWPEYVGLAFWLVGVPGMSWWFQQLGDSADGP